jgi:hypothetical protein
MSTEPTSLEAKKEALSRQTEIYKQAIGEQVNLMKDNAGQTSKRILIIGASLTASYFLIRALTRKNGKKKLKQLKQRTNQKLLGAGNHSYQEGMYASNYNTQPGSHKESNISSLITQQIAIFLIGIATPISRDDKAYIEPIYIK